LSPGANLEENKKNLVGRYLAGAMLSRLRRRGEEEETTSEQRKKRPLQ
jgi:hypothetical protein